MMRFHAIALFVIHGLITAAQSGGLLAGKAKGTANPGLLATWPVRLGESWFLTRFGLENRPVLFLFGLLWLGAGVSFVVAGLGYAGWLVPAGWWPALAVGAAVVSLVLLVLTFHPLYLLAIVVNAHIYMSSRVIDSVEG